MAGWTVVANGDTSAWKPVQPAPTPSPSLVPWYSPTNIVKGIGEGLANTAAGIGNIEQSAFPQSLINSAYGKDFSAGLDTLRDLATPVNTAQKIGKAGEQIGEWFVPGMGEETVLGDLAKAGGKLPALARIAYNAGTSAVLNKAQGGSATTGAVLGGVGGAVGEGLKALAPGMAESALNIQRGDRAYGRNPGVTILNHTTGFTPEGIASSAQGKLDDLVPQLDNLVNVASYPVPVPRPNIRGFLPPPVEETLLHSSPDVTGDLSQPVTLDAPDRPMPLQLGSPRNIASETPLIETPGSDPLMSPMAFDADKFPQRNIVGGVGPQALRDLGSTANTIPSRLTREAFMSGSEHPELSGQLPVSQGILRRFEETVPGEVSGMGPGQYIGEIPGDRGGMGQPQGVLRRLPDMRSSTIPEGNPLFPRYPDLAPNNIASLKGARGIVSGAMDTATARNAEKEYNQLVPIRDFLARRFNTGEQIPEDITPRQLLDLKRGLGADHVHNWNPDVNKGVTDTAKSAYHEMAEELHRVVPGTADLDNTISNLIPVVRRAELADTSAGVTQRIADRIGRPTGGMLGAATGAFFGGPLGAVVGTVLPDLVSAPALKMAAARGMYSPITGQMMKPLIGAGLNLFDRPDQQ
jgi:hypothetical protein